MKKNVMYELRNFSQKKKKKKEEKRKKNDSKDRLYGTFG